jgi:hypothetical protein
MDEILWSVVDIEKIAQKAKERIAWEFDEAGLNREPPHITNGVVRIVLDEANKMIVARTGVDHE